MHVVDISKFEDSVVLHFETEGHRVNAYTLASTLVAIADAAKAANRSINHGYDIEVVVEAIGPGSFRARIKGVYSSTRNLFSAQALFGIVIGVVANYIYERTLSVHESVKVEINTDEVLITRGDEKIIVPRVVYDATRQVEKDHRFVGAVSKAFDVIASDNQVTGFGLVSEMDSPPPEIIATKAIIRQIDLTIPDDPSDRVIHETCDLQIVKAILERGRRKWEFMWRGVKISAPILHDAFYSDFFAHQIMIAPGDVLRVRLAIKQSREESTGIYSNDGYEVYEVYEHIPQIKQTSFPSELD